MSGGTSVTTRVTARLGDGDSQRGKAKWAGLARKCVCVVEQQSWRCGNDVKLADCEALCARSGDS